LRHACRFAAVHQWVAVEGAGARDATAGLTVTRLANGNGVISFGGTDYQCGRGQPGTAAA